MAYPSVFDEPDRPVHGRRNVDLVKMHVQVPDQKQRCLPLRGRQDDPVDLGCQMLLGVAVRQLQV